MKWRMRVLTLPMERHEILFLACYVIVSPLRYDDNAQYIHISIEILLNHSINHKSPSNRTSTELTNEIHQLDKELVNNTIYVHDTSI